MAARDIFSVFFISSLRRFRRKNSKSIVLEMAHSKLTFRIITYTSFLVLLAPLYDEKYLAHGTARAMYPFPSLYPTIITICIFFNWFLIQLT